MLLSIYQANQAWGGCGRGCHDDDNRSNSEFDLDEVDSLDEAVERCIRRVADNEQYSVSSAAPDADFSFVFIRIATMPEGSVEFETYQDETIAGEVCGKLVKFDLSGVVSARVRVMRAEAERQRQAAAEAAAQRRQALEAERAKRERFEQFKVLQREFEPAVAAPSVEEK